MSVRHGGGGAATQSGTNYQNCVAAWFAVSILAEEAVSPPWNLPAKVTLEFLRCETEQPVDDLLIGTSEKGHAFIQAKHSLSLQPAPESELGKTINQFVRQFLAYPEKEGNRLWERPLDASRDRLVLITSPASPNSITKELYSALEKSRHQFAESETALNQKEIKALDTIKEQIIAAWQSLKGSTPADAEIQEILRLIYVQTLDIDSGGNDEIYAKERLRTSVLAEATQSDLAWGTLINICTKFAINRSGADRTALQSLLSQQGIFLKPARSYQNDIEKLREYSCATFTALSKLSISKIEVGKQKVIKISRQVTQALRLAANQESLLLIGDPGTGKSGTIYDFVQELYDENHDVVFLSVDRFDVNNNYDLQNELGLEHPLENVLNNWQTSKPAWLVIDALDAARSANSVKIFRQLITNIIKSSYRWKVIASIRKFDLRYSIELQKLFQGNSNVSDNFRDSEFAHIRHINVPKLTQEELNEIKAKSEVLAEFIDNADEKLQELLTIPFNLRLIADLLGINISVESLTPIQTQIELLDRFWQVRVISSDDACGDAREALLQQAVEKMVATRTLRVNRSEVISNTASSGDASRFLHQILSSHILVEWKRAQNAKVERSILTFSHHVLFDYAVSRLFLRGLPQTTVERLEADLDLVLAIRPSLVFHFQHLWFIDPSRGEFWEFIFQILQSNTIPEIGKLIGPSVAADLIADIADCEQLFNILETNPPPNDKNPVYQTLSHLVGAILVDFSTSVRPLAGSDAPPWCELIERCSHSLNLELFKVVRPLVWNICEQADRLNTEQLYLAGIAARKFFDFAWKEDILRQRFISRELQAVCHTFNSNPSQSADLIRRCLTANAMKAYGFTSIFWLAEEIENLIPHDPELVADIYRIAFSYDEESEAQTVLGGRILPLISTQKQDFESGLYSLGHNFSKFLSFAPIYATRTLIAVIEAYVAKSHPLRGSVDEEKSFDFDNYRATIKTDHSYIWDSATYSHDTPMKMLHEFCKYLGHISEDANQLNELRKLINVVIVENKLAIIWRYLLKCGIKYPTTLGQKIRYLVWATPILISYDTTTLAGDFIKKIFVHLPSKEREKVELAILSIPELFGDGYEESSQHMRNRLLGCLEPNAIITQEAKLILEEAISQGGLPPNLPLFRQGEVEFRPYGEKDYLANYGVPVTAEANLRIQELEEPVKAFSENYLNSSPDTHTLETIFPALQSLYATLQTADTDGVHPQQCNYAWGVLAAACDRIAVLETLSCETDLGRFIKQVLLEASKQPEPIHYPEFDTQFDESQSWGSPAARIDAAQGLTKLTRHSNCIDDELLATVEQLTYDPVPAVRYQVTSNLLWMYKTAPQLMWRIISRITREEASRGVLHGLLYPLGRLSSSHGESVAELIKVIFDRVTDGSGSKQIREYCTSIFFGLDVWQDNPIAREVISQIASHPDEFYIEASRIVIEVRDYLTLGSVEPVEPSKEKVRKRALNIISQILDSSSSILGELQTQHQGNLFEQWSEQNQEKFKSLVRLADSIAMQIYFASGAFDEKRNGLQQSSNIPLSLQAKRRFLQEVSPILDSFSQLSCFSSIVHRLLETLTFLVDIDPKEIFLRIGHIVQNGKNGYYEYEFQGDELVVKFIERFLAEYRYILRDSEECRRVLIETLDTFVRAGWLSARRLTYRLEEIFR